MRVIRVQGVCSCKGPIVITTDKHTLALSVGSTVISWVKVFMRRRHPTATNQLGSPALMESPSILGLLVLVLHVLYILVGQQL